MRGGTVLGFDHGSQRIGVAVGNLTSGTAEGLCTLRGRDGSPDWDEIAALLAEWSPQHLVVGLPLTMEDDEQPATQAARRFGNRLHGRFGLPVEWIDERLTSVAAERQLSARQRQRDPGAVDRLAAREILLTWIAQQEQH